MAVFKRLLCHFVFPWNNTWGAGKLTWGQPGTVKHCPDPVWLSDVLPDLAFRKTLLMMIPAVNLISTLHRNPNNVLYRVTHCVVQECNCDWRQGRAGLCLVRGFRGFRMSAPVLLWCLNCHLHAPRSFSFSLVSARTATKASTIITSSFSQTRKSSFIF